MLLFPNISVTGITVMTASTGLRKRQDLDLAGRNPGFHPSRCSGLKEKPKGTSPDPCLLLTRRERDSQGVPTPSPLPLFVCWEGGSFAGTKGPQTRPVSPRFVEAPEVPLSLPALRSFSHPLDCAGSEPILV